MVGRTKPGDSSHPDFYYILLYRLRTMTDDEKREWFKQWGTIRNKLPAGIKILAEAGSAFGTAFTGFTIFEGPFDMFDETIDILDKHTGHLVEKTRTIIGTKGFVSPSTEMLRILETRPID